MAIPSNLSNMKPIIVQQGSQSTAPIQGAQGKNTPQGGNQSSIPTTAIQQFLGIKVDGDYGPQTIAAVKAFQEKNGLNSDGIVGPQTIAAMQKSSQQTSPAPTPTTSSTQSSNSSTTTVPGTDTITVPPTGNPQLDQIQTAITGLANTIVQSGYTIPEGLKITPELVSQFLSYAHQAVDPYTKQLLSSEIQNVNADLQNQQTQYQNQAAETVQQFGTQLSTQDNTAGANGVAFSGQRQLNDNNLVNSTNRSLSSLASTAAFNAGNTLRAGGAAVGADNANQFNLPTFGTSSVGLGGQRGTANPSGTASLNYDPTTYSVGSIPSSQTQSVDQQQQSYISQYGALAGAQSNSGRSVSDLIGMISGLPAGYNNLT